MNDTHLLSTKTFEHLIANRKKIVTGMTVNWLQMQWIKLERLEPYYIKFNKDTEFNAIDIKKFQTRRPSIFTITIVQFLLLYACDRSITEDIFHPSNIIGLHIIKTNRGDYL